MGEPNFSYFLDIEFLHWPLYFATFVANLYPEKTVILGYTTEKNITNTLTLVPVGMHVGFEGPRHVLLY